MNIIKFFNNDNAIIELSEKEKNAINVVNDVLKVIEENVKDDRDIFELKYAQKFLKMISSLENVKDITNNIDKILVDEDLFKDPYVISREGDIASFSESLRDILKMIEDFDEQDSAGEEERRGEEI